MHWPTDGIESTDAEGLRVDHAKKYLPAFMITGGFGPADGQELVPCCKTAC
jgi:hypothetical protein